jgi:hypothetical protein
MAKFTGERKYAEEGIQDLALAKKHFAKVAKEADEIAAAQSMEAVQKLYLETHGHSQAGVRAYPHSPGQATAKPLKSAWSRTEHDSGHISMLILVHRNVGLPSGSMAYSSTRARAPAVWRRSGAALPQRWC